MSGNTILANASLSEQATRLDSAPPRRPFAAGRKTGRGLLAIAPTRAERVAALELKHRFGRLALTPAALLETAADIAAATGLPADTAADDRILRALLRQASHRHLATLQQAATQAERAHDRILWLEPSQAQQAARELAEQALAEARTRVYVAREQANAAIEDTIDTLVRDGALDSGVTLGDLATLLLVAVA